MKHPARFWVGSIGILGLVDLWADRNQIEGDTFSEFNRNLFGTDSLAGKVRFCAAWGIFSAWYVPHIIRGAKRSLT